LETLKNVHGGDMRKGGTTRRIEELERIKEEEKDYKLAITREKMR
jgi:hypothetical protein